MPSRKHARFTVKDLPACWRVASLMVVLGCFRHLAAMRIPMAWHVRLFFGELEANQSWNKSIRRRAFGELIAEFL